MIEIQNIITDRFILRQITQQDSLSIFKILKDEDTIRFLNMKKPESVYDTDVIIKEYLEHYKEGTKFPFAITEKETGNLIGVFLIKLDLFDDDCFEFTVYIDKSFWNRGIYSEVMPFMMKFAFSEIKTENFRGFIMISNRASASVMLKNGFVLEKTFKVDGLPEMIESYLMTRNQYLKSCS